MNDNRDLHDNLAHIAERVNPVDLLQRSLNRSAQIRRRNVAATAVAGLVVLVALGVAGLRFLPASQASPVPPASPSTVVPTSPNTSPDPDATLPPPALIDVTPDFKNATLPFPAWARQGVFGACTTGPITLVNGTYGTNTQIYLANAYATTIGGQPAYLLNLVCGGPDQGGTGQLVAYRKDGAGAYSVVGTVVQSDHLGGATSSATGISVIRSVEAAGVDRFRVTVVQATMTGGPLPEAAYVKQAREYSWNGTGFVQSAGSTSFIADPAVAAVTVQAGRMTVTPATAQGCRTASLTITVRNGGPQAADLSAAVFYPSANNAPETCASRTQDGFGASVVPIGSVAAGETRSVTLTTVVGEPSGPPVVDEPENVIQLRNADRWYVNMSRYVIEYAS